MAAAPTPTTEKLPTNLEDALKELRDARVERDALRRGLSSDYYLRAMSLWKDQAMACDASLKVLKRGDGCLARLQGLEEDLALQRKGQSAPPDCQSLLNVCQAARIRNDTEMQRLAPIQALCVKRLGFDHYGVPNWEDACTNPGLSAPESADLRAQLNECTVKRTAAERDAAQLPAARTQSSTCSQLLQNCRNTVANAGLPPLPKAPSGGRPAPLMNNTRFENPNLERDQEDSYDSEGRSSVLAPASWSVPANAPLAVALVRNNASRFNAAVASPDGFQMVALYNPRSPLASPGPQPPPPAWIEQRVEGLVAGTPYAVYVRVRNLNNGSVGGRNRFGIFTPPPARGTLEVAWNGQRLGAPVQPAATGWDLLTFPFTPTATKGVVRVTNTGIRDESTLLLAAVLVM